MGTGEQDQGWSEDSVGMAGRLPGPLRRHPVTASVVGIVLLALLLRVVALGGRVFHWDEARVGYWVLRYHDTGEFFYRPIIHGPFLPIVNDYVFAVLSPTDFSARLIVAVVGALLPLAALLFRDHLRDTEVVVFALLLATNPILVYYSRFMRNDVLVAAFSVFALGFVVRGIDRGDVRYLYPAAAAMALAFATKGNALLYLLSFLGAAVLIYDHRLVREAATGRPASQVVREHGRQTIDGLRSSGGSLWRGVARVTGHTIGAIGVFLAVTVFFFAPRPAFWAGMSDPRLLPGVVNEATLGSAEELYDLWIGGEKQVHDYVPFLYDYLATLVHGAPVVVVFAVLGFLLDGYLGEDGGRPLVAFATYWGIAAIVGYPIATDIQAPWITVHAIVPLAIPAAVGITYLLRAGRTALATGNRREAVLAVLVLTAAVGGVAVLNVSYANSTEVEHSQVVQWAQPGNDLGDTLERVRPVIENNEGTDVLYYGTNEPESDRTRLYVTNESSADAPPPGGPAWTTRLPLPWYFEKYGATETSTSPGTDPETIAEDAPPVVVAHDWDRDALEPHLDDHVAYEHRFKMWGQRIVIFVDESALADAESNDR